MKFVVAFLAICSATQANLPRLEGDIVGGHEVDISDFPYQVSIRKHDKHICGGSIINSKTILSAAHCFVFTVLLFQYSVRVGSNAHADGNHYIVRDIIKNKNFNSQTLDNDMAILKLVSRIIYGDAVQPIQLQPMGIEVPAGSTAWVSGWGVTGEGSSLVPPLLRAVEVSVISFEKCFDMFSPIEITSHMLCADTMKHGTCNGDSGGPLVFDGKLIGVVSGGFGCARPEYPGVYAKVSALYDWIVTNTK